MATRIPNSLRLRTARTGSVPGEGKLPVDWSLENVDTVVVEDAESSDAGSALTLSLHAEKPGPEYFSIVLDNYRSFPADDVGVLRLEMQVTSSENIAGAFAVIREWISGGEYVGQATQSIPISKTNVVAVAARTPADDERVLQPLVSFRRAQPGPARLTFRIASVAFAGLCGHPDWLSSPRA